jgi:hypothetical protein
MKLPGTKGRIGLAAGMIGGSVGVVLLSGFGPAPALSSIGSSQTDDTVPTSVPSGTASDASETRTIDAAGAGTVVVAREGNQLTLISATPAAGFTAEVEQAAGAEIEVDFRMAGQRVQVNVEIEDGAIRERVRARDDVAGTDIRIENGVVVRAEGFDDNPAGDDNSGPGSANSGPGNAGEVNDDHGNDADDDDVADDVNDDHGHDAVDDHGNDAVDDHGGDRSGSGSDSGGSGRGGSDDPAGDDHSGRG